MAKKEVPGKSLSITRCYHLCYSVFSASLLEPGRFLGPQKDLKGRTFGAGKITVLHGELCKPWLSPTLLMSYEHAAVSQQSRTGPRPPTALPCLQNWGFSSCLLGTCGQAHLEHCPLLHWPRTSCRHGWVTSSPEIHTIH